MAQLLHDNNQEIFIDFKSKGTHHGLENIIAILIYPVTATFQRYLIMTQEQSL